VAPPFSKAYGLIDLFSEDIDLTIDKEYLGIDWKIITYSDLHLDFGTDFKLPFSSDAYLIDLFGSDHFCNSIL
jgi:hypothetical protein